MVSLERRLAFGVWVDFFDFVADMTMIFSCLNHCIYMYTLYIQVCMNIYKSSYFICGLQTYVLKPGANQPSGLKFCWGCFSRNDPFQIS